MPQAPCILSKSQILALESCYLFFRTLPALLKSIGDEVSPIARGQSDEQAKLAVMNRARLMASFPEVAEAAKRWGGVDPGSITGAYIPGTPFLGSGGTGSVPEPSSLLLLGTGLVGMLGALKRKLIA